MKVQLDDNSYLEKKVSLSQKSKEIQMFLMGHGFFSYNTTNHLRGWLSPTYIQIWDKRSAPRHVDLGSIEKKYIEPFIVCQYDIDNGVISLEDIMNLLDYHGMSVPFTHGMHFEYRSVATPLEIAELEARDDHKLEKSKPRVKKRLTKRKYKPARKKKDRA